MFNILGTLYTKLYNQRIMADQQGLRLVTAIPQNETMWTQNENRRGTAMHKKNGVWNHTCFSFKEASTEQPPAY